VATSSDLGTYLGVTVDDVRAQQFIDWATALCQSIVNPLPTGADAVILDVAARGYTNPTNAQQETVGPYTVGHGKVGGGLYLTRGNKATLRRLAGGGSAYSVDTLPTGVNCVQTLTISATAGTFTLTFNGQTTSALAYDAGAGAIQLALEALGSVGTANVAVTGAGPFVVTFINNLATTPLPVMSVDTGSLTGSASVALTVAGVRAPGQGLPYWDFDYYNSGGSSLPIG